MTETTDSLRRKTSVISGGQYSLFLADVDREQVLYNGQITYFTKYVRPASGGWCHLLLLKGKNNYSKQVLAILTQSSDCHVSIVNTIEGIATFVLNFFGGEYPPFIYRDSSDDERIIMAPANTIFVEYLPVGCFGPSLHRQSDTLAVMDFDWEAVPDERLGSYFQATKPSGRPMWKYTSHDAINDLIARL